MAYQSINLINLMIQSKNKGHATKWLHNGCLGPSDIKPCNHYTYTEESYKEWDLIASDPFIIYTGSNS